MSGFASSFTGGLMSGAQVYRHMRLDAVASNGAQHLAGVIPVAGATQGNGAFFRTSPQLANGDGGPIDGKLVWHQQGTPGSSSDPSMTFHLDTNASVTYPDIAASMGQSGIGAIDVYTSSLTPDVTARVFNDAGAAGTYGLTEDLVPPQSMLNPDVQFATIPIAADLTNFRVNIGVRTLDEPTTIGLCSTRTAKRSIRSATRRRRIPRITSSRCRWRSSSPISRAPRCRPAGRWWSMSTRARSSTVDNRTKDSDLKMVIAK